jgi:hypothetical protein
VNLPAILDQHLDDVCAQCKRAYLWCECMPAYFTREAFQDMDIINQLLDRWQAEDPDACRPGLATIMRLWGATRRARGWE